MRPLPAGPRVTRSLILFTALVGAMAATPDRAGAQVRAILLQIHPRAGDTLQLRLDQSVEMTGRVRNGDMQSTTHEESSLVLHSTLSVLSADADGATVMATTDSVRLTTQPNSTSGALLGWGKMVEGKRFRFRVSTDGSTFIESATGWAPAASGVFSQLPATLPHDPIPIGSTWSTSMNVPLAGSVDPQSTARLTASFHFDSLSRSGDRAFISISGRLVRPSSGPKAGGVEVVETSGTVSGRVVVDRLRGWITEAQTTVVVNSLVAPTGRNKPPMRVGLTITQWVRVR